MNWQPEELQKLIGRTFRFKKAKKEGIFTVTAYSNEMDGT